MFKVFSVFFGFIVVAIAQLPLNSQRASNQLVFVAALEYQCYIAIEIASKFNLLLSDFQNFPAPMTQILQQEHAMHTKCPLHMKKHHIQIHSVQDQLDHPNFSFFCLPCLSSKCPSPYCCLDPPLEHVCIHAYVCVRGCVRACVCMRVRVCVCVHVPYKSYKYLWCICDYVYRV